MYLCSFCNNERGLGDLLSRAVCRCRLRDSEEGNLSRAKDAGMWVLVCRGQSSTHQLHDCKPQVSEFTDVFYVTAFSGLLCSKEMLNGTGHLTIRETVRSCVRGPSTPTWASPTATMTILHHYFATISCQQGTQHSCSHLKAAWPCMAGLAVPWCLPNPLQNIEAAVTEALLLQEVPVQDPFWPPDIQGEHTWRLLLAVLLCLEAPLGCCCTLLLQSPFTAEGCLGPCHE